MKLKTILVSSILLFSSLAFADTAKVSPLVDEVKTVITEMITLIDAGNYKDLVLTYSSLSDEEKAEFIEMVDAFPEPAVSAGQEMKDALNAALNTTPKEDNGRLIFEMEGTSPMIFFQKDGHWVLK